MAEELSRSCMYSNRKEPRNQLIRVIYGIQRHSATDTVRDDPISVISIAYRSVCKLKLYCRIENETTRAENSILKRSSLNHLL